VLLIITVYIIERNKLGKSKLETINEQLNLEIGERKLTEIQLRASEKLYRFVTDHTLDLIVRMDENLNYLFISPSVLRMFGYSAAENEIIPPLNEIIPDEFKFELKQLYLDMIRTKNPVMLTHQSKRKDGSLFWSESFVNPIFDEKTGKLKETITVIRDITDRVAYEDALSENARQKELLLREIHHRVKNNFAILVSLMNMQKVSSEPGDYQGFLTELQGRIRTMSLVHELLYRSHDLECINFGDYLRQLVGVISGVYKKKQIEISTMLEPCILDVETALPLGLISNEIVTNAYKYAFNGMEEGKLWVELLERREGSRSEHLYTHTLTIKDNGPGLPEGFSIDNQLSMGSQIISLLTQQLDAKLTFSGENGTRFTISFSNEKRL
jgi:PAS domain S-box-containing protein